MDAVKFFQGEREDVQKLWGRLHRMYDSHKPA